MWRLKSRILTPKSTVSEKLVEVEKAMDESTADGESSKLQTKMTILSVEKEGLRQEKAGLRAKEVALLGLLLEKAKLEHQQAAGTMVLSALADAPRPDCTALQGLGRGCLRGVRTPLSIAC